MGGAYIAGIQAYRRRVALLLSLHRVCARVPAPCRDVDVLATPSEPARQCSFMFYWFQGSARCLAAPAGGGSASAEQSLRCLAWCG